MDSLALPLDYTAIERILPAPLSVPARGLESPSSKPDKRIVGIKNVTLNERYLSHQLGTSPALPPTILTEAVAQVGAILILSKPENREKLIFFMGIEKVRYKQPVCPVTSSRSRPGSSGCAAAWGSSMASRACERPHGRERYDDVRAGPADGFLKQFRIQNAEFRMKRRCLDVATHLRSF
jgi:hypothetical protein